MKPLLNLKSFTMVISGFFTNLASGSFSLILIIPSTVNQSNLLSHLIFQTFSSIFFISLAVWSYSYEFRNISRNR